MVQMALTFIATIILLVFLIFYSTKRTKVNYKPILVASINSFVWAAVIFLYEGYIEGSKIEVYLFFGSLAEFLLLLIIIKVILSKIKLNDLYQEVLKQSLGNTKYSHYYIVNEKNKINDMSEMFLLDLGKSLEDVLKKNIFDVFEESISFVTLNDIPTTNQGIKKFYKGLKLDKEVNFTAQFRNVNKELITIIVREKPVESRGVYYGRISIAERHNEDEVLEVQKDLNTKSIELSNVQSRFISTIQIIDEALYYLDLNKGSYWVNDVAKRELDLDYNELDVGSFYDYLHPDDLLKYKESLKECIKKGKANCSYRFKITGTYNWVKEKVILSSNKDLIVGKIELENVELFNKTGKKELDKLKTVDDLKEAIERTAITCPNFQIICFSINNMPDINERRGMFYGNTVLDEYIRVIRKAFVSNDDIYRIAGVDFTFILTDVKKIDILKRSLKMDSSVINLDVEYGGMKETLKASMAGVEYGSDSKDSNELIKYLRRALKEAKSPNSVRNYCYFGDIK